MEIKVKKFGTLFTSRDDGREAYLAIQSDLKKLNKNEDLILDFSGVNTFSPSWGDEFITKLHQNLSNKIILKNTKNKSVFFTLELLAEVNNITFNIVN
jgi:hypothetical protein